MNRRSFVWQSICASVPAVSSGRLAHALTAYSAPRVSDAEIASFTRGISGIVYRPGDPTYEKLRKGYSAKIDAHPALVVHPASVKDIQATLQFVRSAGLPLAVRCGGHSYAGFSTCEGGLVLDMSGFNSIDIAPDRKSARIGGGVLCGAIEIETAKHGLAAVLGQCPSVGVGGYLLGGGISPLMCKYGVGSDNILAADLVLADGRMVHASKTSEPDLYWAIRGGGGNFGIVTAFEVALHPVSQVFAGVLSLQADDLRPMLKAYRDFYPSAPDDLTLIAQISRQPGKKASLEIQVCCVGDPVAAEKCLEPLRRHPLLVHDGLQHMPYLKLEQMVPAEIPPSYEEHASGFFTDLDDRTVEIFASAFAEASLPVNCFLGHFHGAITRVPVSATPFPLRRAGIAYDAAIYWQPETGSKAAVDWIHAFRSRLPVDQYGRYVNIMEREDEQAVRQAYASNYARLQHLKARYDPQNMFALNQNIRPA